MPEYGCTDAFNSSTSKISKHEPVAITEPNIQPLSFRSVRPSTSCSSKNLWSFLKYDTVSRLKTDNTAVAYGSSAQINSTSNNKDLTCNLEPTPLAYESKLAFRDGYRPVRCSTMSADSHEKSLTPNVSTSFYASDDASKSVLGFVDPLLGRMSAAVSSNHILAVQNQPPNAPEDSSGPNRSRLSQNNNRSYNFLPVKDELRVTSKPVDGRYETEASFGDWSSQPITEDIFESPNA